jgi:hypothetical protein
VRKLKTSSLPWFGIAVLLFVLGSVIGGDAGTDLHLVGLFVGLGACIRALALAVRDDPVSSSTILLPTARMMGWMSAESRAKRRKHDRGEES